MKFLLPQQPSCGTETNIRMRLPDGSLVPIKEWASRIFTEDELHQMANYIGEAIKKQLDKPK